MNLLRTLRESAEPIQGICLCKSSGNFVSYDHSALRLWGQQRQIRALHHSSDYKNLRFVTMFSFDPLDAVLMVFERQRKDDRVAVLRLVSSQLAILQELELPLGSVIKATLSEDLRTIIVQDRGRQAVVFYLEIMVNASASNPAFPTSVVESFNFVFVQKPPLPDFSSKPKPPELLKAHLIGSFDCKEFDVRDFLVVDAHTIAALAPHAILFLTRSGLLRPPPEEKKLKIGKNFDDEQDSPSRPKARSKHRKSRQDKEKVTDDETNKHIQPSPQGETIALAEEPTPPAAEVAPPSPYQEFQLTSVLRLRWTPQSDAEGDAIHFKQLPNRTLFVAFSDGSIRVVQYQARHLLPHAATAPTHDATADPMPPSLLLCDLPPSNANIINIFPRTGTPTFGLNAYVAECFVVTGDLRVVQLGLRQTDRTYVPSPDSNTDASADDAFGRGRSVASSDQSAASDTPSRHYYEDVDVTLGSGQLAAFDLISEHKFLVPPSKVPQSKLTPARLAPLIQVLSLDLCATDSQPVYRQVVTVFEGTVNLFDLCQPHRSVIALKGVAGKALTCEEANAVQMQHFIQACVRGPDIFAFEATGGLGLGLPAACEDDDPDLDGVEDPDPTFPSLLVLRGECIDLLSGASGRTVQTLNLAHVLSSTLLASAAPLRTTGVIAKDHGPIVGEEGMEGVPTALHWCPYTQLVIAGYSTGSVAAMAFHQPVLPDRCPDFTYIRSSEVHHGPITLVKTFKFKLFVHLIDDPLDPEPGLDVTVLLLGDEQGAVSLWQLHPLKRAGASPLFCCVRQHAGSIVHATLCSVPSGLIKEPVPGDAYTHFDTSDSARKDSNHMVLVTACSRGQVCGWRVEKNLHLDMLAFFHSHRAPTLVTSCLVLPKMVYRKLLVAKPPVYQADSAAPGPALGLSEPEAARKSLEQPRAEEIMPVANLYYELYCVLGYGDGTLEVWSLSSDARYCTSSPIFSIREKECALASVISCRTDDTTKPNQTRSAQKLFLPNSMHQEFTLANRPQDFLWDNPDESPYPNSATEDLLCGFTDGTVIVLEMKINPLFSLDDEAGNVQAESALRICIRRLNHLRLPCRLRTLLPASCHSLHLKTLPRNKYAGPDPGISVWDYFFVSDFEVHVCLPYLSSSKAVPRAWQRRAVLGTEAKAVEKPWRAAPQGVDVWQEYATRSQQSTVAEDSPTAADTASAASESSFANDSLSVSVTAEGSSVMSASSSYSLSRGDKRQYIGPMESMQRIVSSDLHIAKKDKRLLDLFVQGADGPDATMSAEQVVGLVQRWCNERLARTEEIKDDTLRELFKLLEIQPSDMLKFVEVAKVASITLSAVRKGLEIAQKSRGGPAASARAPYKQLRSSRVKVSYNSMGERVVEKVALSEDAMGVPDGTLAQVKSGLRAFVDSHRSHIQTLKANPPAPTKATRLLRALPRPLREALAPCVVSLTSDAWCSSSLHYFDEVRTISIARALLDMRSSSQYEAVDGGEVFRAGVAGVAPLPKLLVKYFERLYGESSLAGEGSMSVSRHKVANYLEACLQYAHHPLLSVLKCGLLLDGAAASVAGHGHGHAHGHSACAEVALWLVVEARSMLISRGSLLAGAVLLPTDQALLSDAILARKESDRSSLPRALYVPRAAAVSVCDELLRVRGQFGPHMFLSVLDTVRGIPALGSDGGEVPLVLAEENRALDLIDAERLLEVLYFEFIRKDETIQQLQRRVFGEYSLNVATAAKSREINTVEVERMQRAPIDDDLGFGPHHSFNLSRIQDLLRQCMLPDTLRTGQLPAAALQEALRVVFFESLRSEDRGREGDCYRLLLLTRAQTKIRSVEDQVSYIDIVAMLLAWEESFQGFKSISAPTLLETLPSVGRSIEASLARDFVQYFSLLSALENMLDPRWVMARPARMNAPTRSLAAAAPMSSSTGTLVETKSQLRIPTDGVWRRDANAPSDEPGLLTVQSVTKLFSANDAQVAPSQALGMPAVERHRKDMELRAQAPPRVVDTGRARLTLTGEVATKGPEPARQAPIAVQRLGLQVAFPSDAFPPGYEVVDDQRVSYSRVMQRIEATHGSPVTVNLTSGLGFTGSRGGVSTAQFLSDELRDQLQADSALGHVQRAPPAGSLDSKLLEESYARLQSQFSDTDSSNALVEDSVDSNYQHFDLAFLGEEVAPPQPQPRPPSSSQASRSGSGSGSAGGLGIAQMSRGDGSITPFLDVREEEVLRQELARGGSLDGSSLDRIGGSELSHQQRSMLLAEAEVTRRVLDLQLVEEEFQAQFASEQDEFARRRLEKEQLREKIRQEMRAKEHEAMKMYHKSMNERDKRKEKARKHLSAIEEAEAADRRAKDQEIQAILERNRSRALTKLHQKVSSEEAASLLEREEAESALMRKEDRASQHIEQRARDDTRKASEALRAAEDAALAKRIAELAALSQQTEERAQERFTPEHRMRLNNAHHRPTSPTSDDELVADLPSIKASELRPDVRRQSSLLQLMQQETASLEPSLATTKSSVEGGEDEDEDEEEDGQPGAEELDFDGEDDMDDAGAHLHLHGGHDLYAFHRAHSDRPLTLMERRIQLLLHNISQAFADQRAHPRRIRGAFSFPLLFSQDVAFRAFDSPIPQLLDWTRKHQASNDEASALDDDDETGTAAGSVGTVGVEGSSTTLRSEAEEDADMLAYCKSPFADIDAAVKRLRRRQEEERMVLFKTQVAEVHAADWTNMARVTRVDWEHFFHKQEAKLELIKAMARGPESVAPAPEESLAAGTGASSVSVASSKRPFSVLRASISIPPAELGIPASLVQVLPENPKETIMPLPFGKVLRRQHVAPEELRFFQIEVVEEDCLVTIELRCVRGLADLYLSRGKLPSAVKHEFKISCTRENDRLARLVVAPEAVGTYFASVATTSQGAEFDLWTYATTESIARSEDHNPRIQHVTKVIDKFRLLAQQPMEDLQVHFPRLEQDAQRRSDEMAVQRAKTHKKRRAVVREMQLLAQAGRLDSVLSKPFSAATSLSSLNKLPGGVEIDEEEIENMESFVVKVGRYAMRKDREAAMLAATNATRTSHADDADSPPRGSVSAAGDAASEAPSSDSSDFTAPARPPPGADNLRRQRSTLHDAEDPNQHADLFTAPTINRRRSIALLTPVQQMLTNSTDDAALELKRLLAEAAGDQPTSPQGGGDGVRFDNFTALLVSNTANLSKRPDGLPSLGSGSSYSSYGSLSSQSELRDALTELHPADIAHLIPASLGHRSSHAAIPSLVIDAQKSRRATAASQLRSVRASMVLGSRRPTAHHASAPELLPAQSGMLTQSLSQSAINARSESKLEQMMDVKGRVKQPKVSQMSHLVFMDPQPIHYKLRSQS